jgi:hypothetical protein
VLGHTDNALTPAQRSSALDAVLAVAGDGRIAVAHETVPLAGVTAAWARQAAGDPGTRLVVLP